MAPFGRPYICSCHTKCQQMLEKNKLPAFHKTRSKTGKKYIFHQPNVSFLKNYSYPNRYTCRETILQEKCILHACFRIKKNRFCHHLKTLPDALPTDRLNRTRSRVRVIKEFPTIQYLVCTCTIVLLYTSLRIVNQTELNVLG